MKRMLVLLPLVGAAPFIHAQSSVTLQGTVDLGVAYVKGSETRRTHMISGGNSNSNSTGTSTSTSTSKLIFPGQENLGGGMCVMFWLESGFNADTGFAQPWH